MAQQQLRPRFGDERIFFVSHIQDDKLSVVPFNADTLYRLLEDEKVLQKIYDGSVNLGTYKLSRISETIADLFYTGPMSSYFKLLFDLYKKGEFFTNFIILDLNRLRNDAVEL